MRRGSVLVVLAIVVPVLVCGAALVVGWWSTRGPRRSDRTTSAGGPARGAGGNQDAGVPSATVADRAGPGFVQEATPRQGAAPVPGATTVPGRLSDAAFDISYPPEWHVTKLSDRVSSGWEWSQPDRPNSTVRVRHYDNEVASSGSRAALFGAEGDRRAAVAGKFPGYQPGARDEVPMGGRPAGHRTASFTVTGQPATGEQWLTTGTAGAVITLTVVVTEPDDPAPYRQLAQDLVDGGLRVR